MRNPGFTAAALLVAAALPFAVATDALAQSKAAPGAAGPAGGGGARSAPSVSSMPAGPVGGGGMRSGGAVVGSSASKAGAVAIAPSAGPQVNWSGPRTGGYHRHHRHHRHFHGPSFGFGTGLLLGGAYAASPYYYDDPYYYDYDDGYVVGAAGASPEDIAYCRQRYRSYDVRTGTFLGNDGRRHPCP